MKWPATLAVVVITIFGAALLGYEWHEDARAERQAAWERGLQAGAESMEWQCRTLPECDTSSCQSMFDGYVRDDADWVEYMLESCELDNIECQSLGGCNPVVRDLSPWQETFVRTHEPDMAADGPDVRPRVRLPETGE